MVTAGVTAGLKTALPELIKASYDQISSGGSIQRQAPAPVRTEATIADVSEEDILNAIESNDKPLAARLMRQQRQASEQRQARVIAGITAAGGAAFGSVSRMAADRLPYYHGKYKKLIDERVAQFQENNPGVMITPEHYEWAHNFVVGEHNAEIIAQDREEVIRKSREPDPALIPDGGRRYVDDTPKEPTSLNELLAGDWKGEFHRKQRAVGGRSDEEELKKMGFAGGFKEVVATRKAMDALAEETVDSFGLDRDWVDDKGRSGPRADKTKGAWV
jgi:hypothetical protein